MALFQFYKLKLTPIFCLFRSHSFTQNQMPMQMKISRFNQPPPDIVSNRPQGARLPTPSPVLVDTRNLTNNSIRPAVKKASQTLDQRARFNQPPPDIVSNRPQGARLPTPTRTGKKLVIRPATSYSAPPTKLISRPPASAQSSVLP